jgi:hypothetical protein
MRVLFFGQGRFDLDLDCLRWTSNDLDTRILLQGHGSQ